MALSEGVLTLLADLARAESSSTPAFRRWQRKARLELAEHYRFEQPLAEPPDRCPVCGAWMQLESCRCGTVLYCCTHKCGYEDEWDQTSI